LKPEPIFEAVESLARENTQVILLSPAGRRFNQAIARELAGLEHLLMVCAITKVLTSGCASSCR